MPSPHPDLPLDVPRCHALIGRLREDLRRASETGEQWRSKAEDAEARIVELEGLLAEQQRTLADQQQTIEQLSADNKLLKRSLFGSRRERFTDDPAQTLLFEMQSLESEGAGEDDADESTPPAKRRTSRGRQRRVIPDFIPREEQQHLLEDSEIPEALRDNPRARRFFKKVGERLELVPARLTLIEEYQEVIALDESDATTTMVAAKRPPRLIQSFAGDSLLAYLTVSRFADHLPYYRLENIVGRCGVHIDRATQWRWMHRIAEALTPLVDLMWERALRSWVIAMDETPVKELGGPGKALTGYLWAGVGDAEHPYDCFFYSSDRRMVRPQTYLAGFRGYLLTDAYVGYERIGHLWPGVHKASCWVHARRKFEECHHLGKTAQTRKALSYFQRLFNIEDKYRTSTEQERLAARLEKSRPLVEAFHQWMLDESTRQLPKSKLLGAINYMLNRWESFTRFLESGLVPMDNNIAERAVKYPVLGRKAWLFVGNPQAGETAAKLFTLTKTCNRHYLDPYAYLRDVFERLPAMSREELPALLPDRWLEEHPQHLLPERVREAIDRAQRARERRDARRRAA